MIVYPWGVHGSRPPIRVYGPARMAALHTDVGQVGGVAERAGVRELILSHYLPPDPRAVTEADWARRAGYGFGGRTTAGHDGLRRALGLCGYGRLQCWLEPLLQV